MSIARVPIGPVDELPVLTPPDLVVAEHGLARRVLELTFAVTALLVLAPLLLTIALTVVATSRGPVIYRQTRVGHGGRTFEILKFRTMTRDAFELADELFARRNDGSGPLNKVHDDPRVTRVGRWLRRFSLDELPQLWNVVNGTMALVGPRPATPHEVAKFTPRDHRRHAVRPGVTGITQVSGRSDLDWEDAIRLDLHYVENRSLTFDLRILLRTVPAVLRARGAY